MREPVFFKDTFDTLVKLYSEGGIEICTPENASGKGAPENGQPLLARTVVQPDADVIAYVSQEILVQPEIWQDHLNRTRDRLDWIRQLRRFLRWVKVCSPAFLVWGGWSVLNGQITRSILCLFLTLFFALLKPVVRFWFQQRLKREIRKAWSN